MESINLLTNEFTAKSANVKLARGLKITGFILLSLFIVAALALSVSFIVTNRDLSRTKQSQAQLAESIRLMGDVENKYVLVKDRADRIASALSADSAQENIEYFNQFLTELSEEVDVTSINTETDNIEFSVSAASINEISTIMDRLAKESVYAEITLENFQFSNENGYLLDFVMNN